MEYTHLGRRIRKARESQGYTQGDLATRVGVKISVIEQWETDVSTPRVNRLNTMAGILNVPLLWLLAGSDQIPDPFEPMSREDLVNQKIELAEQNLKDLAAMLNEIKLLSRHVETD